ncbi:hypothetical protein PENTCL1PPCAC_13778, partial [Pristionchus entomophagus]
QMSGAMCFNVSTSGDPHSLRVTDVIRSMANVVTIDKRILSHCITDSHLFVVTDDSVFVLRLDALRDTPLTASLDISSPDLFRFKPDSEATVTVEGIAIDQVRCKNPVPSSSNVMLTSTHSRVFLVDQRGDESQKMYCIFDESSRFRRDGATMMQLQLPEEMGRITRVEGGADHIVALTETGRVWAMGTGSHGELGVGGVHSSPQEFLECDLPDDVIVEDIANGSWHSVAITDSKDVYVWGWNREGQLGEDQEKCVYSPMPLDVDDVISIDAKECTTVLTTRDDTGHARTITYGSQLIREDNDD